MNVYRCFENQMGGRWIGVRFHHRGSGQEAMTSRPMYFCEAVLASSTGPLTLTKTLLSCPGAQRSFGWSVKGDGGLVEKLASGSGLPHSTAKALIAKTPCIDTEKITAVTVGTYDAPDVLLSYLQPETAMRFVLQWQNAHIESLDLSFSSVMAVCGNVAAGAYATGRVCCSFACSESRAHGNIGRDRLVIGVPARMAAELVQSALERSYRK
jgi:uncharacterized protein (DUF169 family)